MSLLPDPAVVFVRRAGLFPAPILDADAHVPVVARIGDPPRDLFAIGPVPQQDVANTGIRRTGPTAVAIRPAKDQEAVVLVVAEVEYLASADIVVVVPVAFKGISRKRRKGQSKCCSNPQQNLSKHVFLLSTHQDHS